jgi:hypothetical protein
MMYKINNFYESNKDIALKINKLLNNKWLNKNYLRDQSIISF